MPNPLPVTELLKNPKKVQKEVANGTTFHVFSRSKWIFTISPPEPNISHNKADSASELPTFSLDVKKSIHRKDIYSQNSWLDQ